ncbi:hypothetical protein FEI13_12245 [Halomonas urmiana]|uniref:Uncharacterized protein n=1 Tax=Halomonas urmiana TaxID=490901 RepID=A0A5R8MEZ0_9GAMM|nr:hypothetical protein [Halomonas urmiana]TLF48694.1 hypothetical protein FEI13_12245 [Halomonas urmiana]
MKLTTLTAILLISLGSVSASLASDSTYLQERTARLHQEIADTRQARGQGMMGTERIQSRELQQTFQRGQQLRQQERWWK